MCEMAGKESIGIAHLHSGENKAVKTTGRPVGERRGNGGFARFFLQLVCPPSEGLPSACRAAARSAADGPGPCFKPAR